MGTYLIEEREPLELCMVKGRTVWLGVRSEHYLGVAQFGSAPALGAGGRGFESLYPDKHQIKTWQTAEGMLVFNGKHENYTVTFQDTRCVETTYFRGTGCCGFESHRPLAVVAQWKSVGS